MNPELTLSLGKIRVKVGDTIHLPNFPNCKVEAVTSNQVRLKHEKAVFLLPRSIVEAYVNQVPK